MRRSHKLLLVLLVWAFVLRLGYASVDLHAGRFFDERIALENVAAFLEDPGWKPEHFWYQKLSYLPEALLLSGVDALGVEVYREGRFTATAYFLGRSTHVLYGTLTLLWTFLLGRRLASDSVGLAAALLLSIVPWHVISSAQLKPDILLLLLTLVTLHELVKLVHDPRLGRYLRVGAGVGLTTATKLNGAPVVVPLLLFSCFRIWRNPRRLRGLAAALLVAAGVYLTLDPWVPETLETLQSNREHYARREAREAAPGPPIPVATLRALPREEFHGPLVALLAVLGLAWLAWDHPRRHPARWLVLAYPVAYVLIYALLTDRFKSNHLVQVIPFTSLLAAVAVVQGARTVWSRLEARWRRPAVAWGVTTLAVAVAIAPTHRFVYREMTPSTIELGLRKAHVELPDDRLRFVVVIAEDDELPRRLPLRNHPLVVQAHETLAPVSRSTWSRSDAWIVPADGLDSPAAEPLLSLLAKTPPEQILRLRPAGWLQTRGPELLVRLQPLELLETTRLNLEKPSTDSIRFELPASPGDGPRLASLEVWVPGRRVVDTFPAVREAPVELELLWVGGQGPGHRYAAPRFELPATGGVVELGFPAPVETGGRPMRVLLNRWD